MPQHRRNHSQGGSGENPRRKTQSNSGTRTARRTRRSGAMMKKNREKQSQQQAQEQSQQQAQEQSQRQAKANQRTANRDKAKYEEKHSTEESCSQRCRCPAGAVPRDHDYPKHRLRQGVHGAAQKQRQKIPKIVLDSLSLKSRRLMKSAQRAKAAEVSSNEQKTSVNQGGCRIEKH